MPNDHTRRDFLKASGFTAAGLAASATGKRFSAATAMPSSSGELSLWITDEEHKLTKQPPLRWTSISGEASANSVVVDLSKKTQPILGFGAAFTDAACYTFNQLDAAAREKLFHELFHPSEMGLSVCRTCIGSSDYSTEVFSYDEGDPDPDLKRFSIDHDRAYVLPILREARKANPNLFLFSSPWSPPGWMKSNKGCATS